jgi:hypothetical protein
LVDASAVSSPEQIALAIAAHGTWKSRLKEAIHSGKSVASVATVRADHKCEFGGWLQTLSAAEKKQPECQQVQALHTQFHREAARTLKLALAGKREAAEQAMALDGPFARSSSALTVSLMAWRQKLGG